MAKWFSCGYVQEARKGVWKIYVYTHERAFAKLLHGLDLVGYLNVSDLDD